MAFSIVPRSFRAATSVVNFDRSSPAAGETLPWQATHLAANIGLTSCAKVGGTGGALGGAACTERRVATAIVPAASASAVFRTVVMPWVLID